MASRRVTYCGHMHSRMHTVLGLSIRNMRERTKLEWIKRNYPKKVESSILQGGKVEFRVVS